MPHTPEPPQSLEDQILDIQNEAKKNKVQLTPEIQKYIREHFEAIQRKLANGEPVYKEDLEFIKEARVWIKLLSALEARFAKKPKYYKRPEGVDFAEVKKALGANPTLMRSLAQMENTGGEPDIIAVEPDAFVFGDCSEESPNRRNLTYDQATVQAKEFGVDMMSEEDYLKMQNLGKFDQQSSSWLATPEDIRKTGRAVRGNRGGAGVGVYEGAAGARGPGLGWRASLRVKKV